MTFGKTNIRLSTVVGLFYNNKTNDDDLPIMKYCEPDYMVPSIKSLYVIYELAGFGKNGGCSTIELWIATATS